MLMMLPIGIASFMTGDAKPIWTERFDSKKIVMHVLITETKGHTASKANFASQHVSEHFIAHGHIKK